ncbi:MAG: outer membrane lipoprotein-sorting protein [Nitrospirae bacterium]|nr:outer membrane lipoprotein-sorting protein [Nitrospirota bacterium]
MSKRGAMFLVFWLCLGISVLSATTPSTTYAELTADQIVAKSEDVHPGADQQSKLTFIIREADGAERKVVLRRYWKNYTQDSDIDSKVLVFNEYPPDTKGNAFMVWTYKSSSQKPEDLWIYLPILRKVQKLPEHPDEIFSGANLKPADMIPRDVSLDKHKLLREETIENQHYYVIESVPKSKSPNYTYGKIVKWINKNDFLKERIDYYDTDSALLKKQLITWKKVKDAYVWEKVVLTNVKTDVQTILNISDVEINTGLTDSSFTERTMSSGRVR